jgi:hypothetical protein
MAAHCTATNVDLEIKLHRTYERIVGGFDRGSDRTPGSLRETPSECLRATCAYSAIQDRDGRLT